MGAPKQKWTSEEEAALKAGVNKYGVGKWSTILKDPEFSTILQARSNVDLKDKWRNINVMTNGLGSRQRGRAAVKNQLIPRPDYTSGTSKAITASKLEVSEAKALAITSGPIQELDSKKPISSLDDVTVEAIRNLKEPRGSSRTTIATYIQDKYAAPPNIEKLLTAHLKVLTENRKLIKVKHYYRIAPIATSFHMEKVTLSDVLEGKQKEHPTLHKNDAKMLSKAQIDEELDKMKSMTIAEAAAIAAQAVAEADTAMAEAERAAREAEVIEAEAEKARCFVEAATAALEVEHCKPDGENGSLR